LRKFDELASQSSIVKPENYKKYESACAMSIKLGDYSYEAMNRLARYIKARREGSTTDTIHETIYNVTESHLGVPESSMWDECRKMLNGLLQDVTTLAENILDPDVAVKGSSYFCPG